MRRLIYLIALLPFLAISQSIQPLKAPNGLVVIGNTIAPSAYVDIQGTAKGFLAPRLNTTQQNAISSPATGLLIFNTTTGLYTFYNGSAWVAVGGNSGYDSLQAMYDVDPIKTTLVEGVHNLELTPNGVNIFETGEGQYVSIEANAGISQSNIDGTVNVKLKADNVTENYNILWPNITGSGEHTPVFSVNGTPADTSGNVVVGTTGDYIPLAGTDVGSPVTGEILFTNGTQSLNISKSALTFNDGVGNSYGITHNEFTGFVNYGVDNPIGGSVGMSSDPVNDICEIKVHGSLATEGSLRTYSTDTRLTLNSPDDIGTATIKQSNDDFYISTADAGNEIKLQFPSPNSGANGVASIKPITDGSTKPLAYVEDIPLVDSVPTDGSTNAVSSNGAFDALTTKQPTITGAATTITGSNLIANRAVISNGSGKVAVSAVTDAELGYVAGATSNLQTQINAKGSGTVTNVTSSDSSTATVATGTTTPVITIVSAPKLQTARTIAGVPFDGTANIAIAASGLSNGTTGSGSVVLATSPTLVTPALGTPSAVVLTNGTGLPESGVTNLVTDLAAKAPLASPAFTGNPTVPNQTLGDNDTSAANTAFVQAAIGAITPTTKTSLGLATTTTDNAISRYDGTGGNTQNSVVQIDDNGGIIVPGVTSSSFTAKKIEYDNTINQWIAYDNDSNVALNLGYETWFLCVNNTGSSIPNGSVVYISGASSGTPTIALAKADAGSTAVGIGITTEGIANGATGKVTQSGLVNGVNTGSLSAGAVYVSETTAGALTNTIPSAPNYRMRVGFVGVVNASTGTVLVTPSTAALGNGTANQIEGMNAAGTAKEVKSIIGTANQVAVTNTAGQIQFGFPSTIVIPTGSTATTPAQNDYSTTVATTAYVDRRFPFMRLSSAYVLTSQTALQKVFNVGASAGGALTAGTRLYYFTGQISLSALSATNGTVSFGWLGTATIGSVRYTSFTVKAATPAASLMGNVTATSATVITATTTGTTAVLQVSGYVSVSGAGTLIPAIGMSVAAPANVDANSGIVFNDLGASTATASPDVN